MAGIFIPVGNHYFHYFFKVEILSEYLESFPCSVGSKRRHPIEIGAQGSHCSGHSSVPRPVAALQTARHTTGASKAAAKPGDSRGQPQVGGGAEGGEDRG